MNETSKNAPARLQEALDQARQRYVARNPLSRQQHMIARRVMPGGSTRSSLWVDPFPLTVACAQGCRLRSADGDEYVDFLGEYTVAIAGHDPEAVRRAVSGQLEAGWGFGAHSAIEQRAAAAVCERFPAIESVRFTNSGTEANLLAISLARAHTGRDAVVVFRGGYHGSVFAFGHAPSRLNAPFEFTVAPYNDLAETTRLVQQLPEPPAAIVMELMQGSAGCIPAEPSFLQGVSELAAATGALLVVDEVMTSRIGPSGLAARAGVRPDIVTLGKYIGGGFSFGAFGGRRELMDHFDLSRPGAWVHAGTFNNNVFTMSAAVAMLTEVYTPAQAEQLTRTGETTRQRLNAAAAAAGLAVQATGLGSMMNVHFGSAPIRSVDDAARADPQLRDLFHLHMLDAGLWIARRGMINLSLATGPREIDELVAAFEIFLHRYRQVLPGA
jgi:glutamate-1-semialdehyde 2,1-aminomutase